MNKMTTSVAMLMLINISGTAGAEEARLMMRGDTAATNNGWLVTPLFTVGEIINEHRVPGVLDGLGAFATSDDTVRILANHEIKAGKGQSYTLANGTKLKGARISYFDIERSTLEVTDAGLAYDQIYNRNGNLLSDGEEIDGAKGGLNRLCSARSIKAGQYQFDDNLFFSGEERNNGTEWVLDVDNKSLWAFPAMGRGAWENVTPLETNHVGTVALVAGDDRTAAPLYLYLGRKNAVGDQSFLDRNGLKAGQLFCWRADNGDQTPQEFNGFDRKRNGHFVRLRVRDNKRMGAAGYDAKGYLDAKTLRHQARKKGCFTFSRPEDLHENPKNPNQIAFASTGRGQLYPRDNWGTLYTVQFDLSNIEMPLAAVTILHDADELPRPDLGIRNPDNLTWGHDGYIYVQEDRSVFPKQLFGSSKGIEASVWRVHPTTGNAVRIGEINRDAIYPENSTDSKKSDIGNWESSGILDVTPLFDSKPNETLLIGTVQAHSIKDGDVDKHNLVQGGQLFLMRKLTH